MRADELVALADAHGIDFIHVAGASSNTKGAARPRARTKVEISAGITDVHETVKGKSTRTSKAPAWSQVDLGIAAYGTSQLAWAAAQHTIANDRRPQTIRMLFFGLRYHANKFANQSSWETMLPGRIQRDPKAATKAAGQKRHPVFYVDPLCMLVLDEISFRPAFTAIPPLFAIYMGVEQHTWDERLEPRFRLLQSRYAVWYAAGMRTIQRRINGEEAPEPTASCA